MPLIKYILIRDVLLVVMNNPSKFYRIRLNKYKVTNFWNSNLYEFCTVKVVLVLQKYIPKKIVARSLICSSWSKLKWMFRTMSCKRCMIFLWAVIPFNNTIATDIGWHSFMPALCDILEVHLQSVQVTFAEILKSYRVTRKEAIHVHKFLRMKPFTRMALLFLEQCVSLVTFPLIPTRWEAASRVWIFFLILDNSNI